MKKVKAGLLGLGNIGKVHLNQYLALESEGSAIQLKAICDLDANKFKDSAEYDFNKYDIYTDFAEMLMDDELDYIDICLPTFLHAEMTIQALNKGKHVLCEKPMALNSFDSERMVEAAECNNRLLMIAQCLRFMSEYVYLKDCVDSGRLGNVISANFFRGGNPPISSANRWMLDEKKSGGNLLDFHIHDVDMIYWLFGKPQWVSVLGKNKYENSGYDVVSAHYGYKDMLIHAQSDWSLEGDFEFEMNYRVNFERGNVVYHNGVLIENPSEGKCFIPKLEGIGGVYGEIQYFANAIIHNTPVDQSAPRDTLAVIRILELEKQSADHNGEIVHVTG